MTTDPDEGLDKVAGTARWTAAERARESARSDRLFADPLAEVLAGEAGRALAEQMRGDGSWDNPGLAIRTRFFDDALTDTLAAHGGIRQVVLVAAGMDTRAFRLDLPADVVWFELDRPKLMALKDRELTAAAATPRCARHPVGTDLAGDWTTPLAAAGFDRQQPTAWLIEGLTAYLDTAMVHRLFDQVTALSAPGSDLLCDTIGQSFLDSQEMQSWLAYLTARGTPWKFGTDQPENLLLPRGWQPTVTLFSTVGTRLGRWPFPVFPRDTPGVPQAFLVHATR